MKTRYALVAVLLLMTLSLSFSCIPSAPPAREAPPQKTAKEEPATAPVPKEELVSDGNTTQLRMSLDSSAAVPGGMTGTSIVLVPWEKEAGYQIEGSFPMEGISIEGSLTPREKVQWVLSGKFLSTLEAFNPESPSFQKLGILQEKEGGGLKITDSVVEGLIIFSVPLPDPASAQLAEVREIPFELVIDTPFETMFNVIATPF